MILERNGKNLSKLCEEMDSRAGCVESKVEDAFQQKCFDIQQVKSFFKYYPMMGIPLPDEEALKEKIKQSISNSRKKNYHGGEESCNALPTPEEQAITLLT